MHVGAIGKEGRCAQGHGGQDAAAVAFVQVGAHIGHVAHVVTYVIGNGGGVAGVVFRDVLLHFAHDVGAYIGRFGIDAASHTREERLRTGTHPEGEHSGGDNHQILGIGGVIENLEDTPPDGNIQQAQPHHGKSHHSAAAERDFQAGIEAAHSGVGRTRTGIGGGSHTHITRQAAEETARQEGKRHPGILHAEAIGQDGEQPGQDDKDHNYHLILLPEVGHSAFPHVLGNFFHGRGAFAFLHHLTEEDVRKQQRNHGRCRHQIEQVGHSFKSYSFIRTTKIANYWIRMTTLTA